MSLLSSITTFCQRKGLPAPSFVAGSTDPQIIQLLAMANKVVEDLADRWVWQELTLEAVFTTVDGEDQGLITTLAPFGFRNILKDTIFNRTMRLPLFGPLLQQEWQQLKAVPSTGPFYKYRIRGNHLLFNPLAVAGHICAFEYASTNGVLASDGSTKQFFTADTDELILDERLLRAGMDWVWASAKGLDYAEEKARYEDLAGAAAVRSAPARTLSLDNHSAGFAPGIWVPAGNWPVSNT